MVVPTQGPLVGKRKDLERIQKRKKVNETMIIVAFRLLIPVLRLIKDSLI